METLTLILGNKNYSSWSMRAWLAARQTGAPFAEKVYFLGDPASRAEIRRFSPSGKVPALVHGDLVVWDSLAICEYLVEIFPKARLWPTDRPARAVARSVSAEMHSGFPALRRSMPMNVRGRFPGKGRGEGVAEDIARIRELWTDCRARFGQDGPFLFGKWCMADALYAPVVTRFRTYAVELDPVCEAYAAAVYEHPAVREWREASAAETWVEPAYENPA